MAVKMRLYGLKTCDTCRKAVRALGDAGHPAELIDIRATPLSSADIDRFLGAFGEALVNRRSTTWRGLDAATQAEDPKALLAQYPALMKRPVIDTGADLYLGWGADVRVALL